MQMQTVFLVKLCLMFLLPTGPVGIVAMNFDESKIENRT